MRIYRSEKGLVTAVRVKSKMKDLQESDDSDRLLVLGVGIPKFSWHVPQVVRQTHPKSAEAEKKPKP